MLLVLVLIPGIGIDVGGQQNWIGLPGGFNLQPSEFTKLAFILWSARLLTLRQDRLTDWKEVLLPFLPVAAGSSCSSCSRVTWERRWCSCPSSP